jgi:hypothetical protein
MLTCHVCLSSLYCVFDVLAGCSWCLKKSAQMFQNKHNTVPPKYNNTKYR